MFQLTRKAKMQEGTIWLVAVGAIMAVIFVMYLFNAFRKLLGGVPG